jgi:hypothetical protein
VERWGGRLTHALVELGMADEDTVVGALARALNVPRASLSGLSKDPAALARIPVTFAEQKAVFPVALKDHGKTLLLALADPSDLLVLDEAAALSRARIQPHIAGEDEIAAAIARHYRNTEPPQRSNRARAAVQRSQRHTSDENPVVQVAARTSGEREFTAEALGAAEPTQDPAPPPPSSASPSALSMLDEIFARPTDGWTAEDRERLRGIQENQEKSSLILAAVLELLVEKGHLRRVALEAWRRGEGLPPLPQLRTRG